jgi:hypothetical protein
MEKYLVKGKNWFSNTEEEAVGLTKVVPFLLEDSNYKKTEEYILKLRL